MKLYVSADGQNRDAFALAKKIYQSGLRPDLIIGLWRGGTPIAIAVHEYFVYKGEGCVNFPMKCASYDGMKQTESLVLDLPPSASSLIKDGKTVLVIDDVFDTGKTAAAVKKEIEGLGARAYIATLYYKPANNKTDIIPDFYIHSTDEWIVFPHEIESLTASELREKDSTLADILD